jgi:D-sedoheptulose 7-phosphate isomerase
MRTVLLTGATGAEPAAADLTIQVPSSDTQRIQESHVAIGHVLCELLERQLFPADRRWRG